MGETAENTKVVVYCVHGTRFPPFAWLHRFWHWAFGLLGRKGTDEFPWTDAEGSGSLAGAIAEKFGEAEVRRFPWDGWNTSVARDKASEHLRSELEDDSAHPVVIIGHSHGGNVAVRAVQLLQGQDWVLGIACLGTPFLTPQARDPYGIEWTRTLRNTGLGLAAALAGLMGFGAAAAGVVLAAMLLFTSDVAENITWTLAASMFAAGLVIFAGLAWLGRRFKMQSTIEAIRKQQDELLASWRRPIEPPCLCIHPVGDEAAGWLSFWAVLASVPYVLLHKYVGIPALVAMSVAAFVLVTLPWMWDEEGDNAMRVYIAGLMAVAAACICYWLLVQACLRLVTLIRWLPLTFGTAGDEVLIGRTVSLVPLYARRADFRTVPTARAFKHRVYDEQKAQEELCSWLGDILGRPQSSDDPHRAPNRATPG